MLYGKKRYIGALYESGPDKYDTIDYKGVELKRRDNARFIKEIYKKILMTVIEQGKQGVDNALSILEKFIIDLTSNKLDLESYIITKSLSKKYKLRTKEVEIQESN